jgi:hypothetical protein
MGVRFERIRQWQFPSRLHIPVLRIWPVSLLPTV